MSMKSSIFGKSAIQVSLEHKRKKVVPKPPLALHPPGPNRKENEPPERPPSPTLKPEATRKWDFDRLIKLYPISGTLPPLLSPTLPAAASADGDIPMQMLSPTLPPSFEFNGKGTFTENRESQPLTGRGTSKPRERPSTGKATTPSARATTPATASPSQPPMAKALPQSTSFEQTEHIGLHMYVIKRTPTQSSLTLSLSLPPRFLATLPNARPTNISLGLGIHKKKPTEASGDAERLEGRTSHGESGVWRPVLGEATRPPGHTARVDELTEAPKTDKASLKETTKDLLMKKKAHWSLIARDRKHKADDFKTANPKLALLYSLDSLIVYMVAFDYEDRSRLTTKQLLNERNWNSLLPYIAHVNKLAESANRPSLAGLCLQFQAVISIHMAKILKNAASMYKERRIALKEGKPSANVLGAPDTKTLDEVTERLLLLQEQNLKCYEDAQSMLYKAEALLSLELVNKFYPVTSSHRARKPLRAPGRVDHHSLFPSTDPFYLPVNSFTTLQEMAAYGYLVAKEFARSEGLTFEWALDGKV